LVFWGENPGGQGPGGRGKKRGKKKKTAAMKKKKKKREKGKKKRKKKKKGRKKETKRHLLFVFSGPLGGRGKRGNLNFVFIPAGFLAPARGGGFHDWHPRFGLAGGEKLLACEKGGKKEEKGKIIAAL